MIHYFPEFDYSFKVLSTILIIFFFFCLNVRPIIKHTNYENTYAVVRLNGQQMDHTKCSRRYLYIFYLIGQSAYNPCQRTKNQKQKRKFLRSSLPMISFGLIVTLTAASGLAFQNYFALDPHQVNTFFGNFMLVILWITNISVFVQNVLYPNHLRNVANKFTIIEQIFLNKCQRRICFIYFTNMYRIKIIAGISCWLLSIVVITSLNIISGRDLSVMLHLSFLMLLSIMASIHALWYLDMMQYYVRFFVDSIEFASQERAHQILFGKSDGLTEAIEKLGYFKHLHYKLWDIA